MIIPFGEWMPDQPALANPGAYVANNVIAFANSYGQLRGLNPYTDAITGRCVGATYAVTGDGANHRFAGDETKLYKLSGMAWSNVSKSGNYSGALSWEFARYGDRAIAVNRMNPLQYYDCGTSTLFADLPGSPPQAARIGVVRDFVVLGDLRISGTDYPSRIVWSGYNNTELWTPSRATQSDQRDLRGDGGRVMQIVSGQIGVIFQEHSIWLMRYAGPPTIFTMDEIEVGRGTPAGKSVVRAGESIYYLGQDGFYRFTGGGSQPIGTERVNRWFFNNAVNLSETIASVDIRNTLVMWAFQTSSGSYNNKVIIYNWAADKWSSADVNIEAFSNQPAQGLTLDELDSVMPGGIDAHTFPVDSPQYQGGNLFLAAFNTDHKACSFSGSPLTATLETKEFGDESKTLLRHVRALVDAGQTVTIKAAQRNSQQSLYAYGPSITATSNGLHLVRKKGRYHRVCAEISGGFNHAIGINIETRTAGGR